MRLNGVTCLPVERLFCPALREKVTFLMAPCGKSDVGARALGVAGVDLRAKNRAETLFFPCGEGGFAA